jgi:hypothetical protein
MSTPVTPAIPRLNSPGQFLLELYRRSRVLTITGWIHLAIAGWHARDFPFRLAARDGY